MKIRHFTLTVLILVGVGMGAHATTKYQYVYKGDRDRVVNVKNYTKTYGREGKSYEQYREGVFSTELRMADFHQVDLCGCDVMEFGCNEGALLFACKQLGARKIIGVDINEWCVEQATEKAKSFGFEDATFIQGDLENKLLFASLPQVDTVLVLRTLFIPEIVNNQAVVSDLSRLAKKALYYRGWQPHESNVQRMYEFLMWTDFTRIERVTRVPREGVHLRCGREIFHPEDLPEGAITSDHPDDALLEAEEVYVFTDSDRNPSFGKNCRLLQFVQR